MADLGEKKVTCLGCKNTGPGYYIMTTDDKEHHLCVACILTEIIEFAEANGYTAGQGFKHFNEKDQTLHYKLHDVPDNFNGGWAEYYP